MKLTTFWAEEDLQLVDDGPLPDAPSLSEEPHLVVMERRDDAGRKVEELVDWRANRDLAKADAQAFNTEHSADGWAATIRPDDALCSETTDAPQAG